MTWDAVEKMTLGQILDFCIERYNRRRKAEKEAGIKTGRGKGGGEKRKATQADINAFLGI